MQAAWVRARRVAAIAFQAWVAPAGGHGEAGAPPAQQTLPVNSWQWPPTRMPKGSIALLNGAGEWLKAWTCSWKCLRLRGSMLANWRGRRNEGAQLVSPGDPLILEVNML